MRDPVKLRQYFLGGTIILLLVVGFFFGRWYLDEKFNQINNVASPLSQKNAEIITDIQNKMNVARIRDSLDTIRANQIMEYNTKRIDRIIMILEEMNKKKLNIEKGLPGSFDKSKDMSFYF